MLVQKAFVQSGAARKYKHVNEKVECDSQHRFVLCPASIQCWRPLWTPIIILLKKSNISDKQLFGF